jgi:hypothetical protein
MDMSSAEKLHLPQSFWETVSKYRFLAIALFVVIVSVGVYIVTSTTTETTPITRQPASISFPSPTTHLTVEWIAFVSKYNYNFKYPSGWYVADSKSYVAETNTVTTHISNIPEESFINDPTKNSDPDIFRMVISHDPDKKSTLEDIRKMYSEKQTKDYAITEYNVGNQPGFRVRLNGYNYVFTEHNKKIYFFHLLSTSSKYISYFDQILSTFTFTD